MLIKNLENVKLFISENLLKYCRSLVRYAGANFASSPYRVLIHAMDPVFICERIAYSSIKRFLSPQEILENTITGDRGIGGLETRGTYREGTTKSPFA